MKYYYDKDVAHLSYLGTTLLLAILDCSSSVLWVANVGDSRGVLSNSSSVPKGEVMPLSFDHKPSQVSRLQTLMIYLFWLKVCNLLMLVNLMVLYTF